MENTVENLTSALPENLMGDFMEKLIEYKYYIGAFIVVVIILILYMTIKPFFYPQENMLDTVSASETSETSDVSVEQPNIAIENTQEQAVQGQDVEVQGIQPFQANSDLTDSSSTFSYIKQKQN